MHSRFLASIVALLLVGTCFAADPPPVRITVDASKTIRTVDSRLFGINTAFWDAQLDTPETIAALRELGVTTLRFPGGSFSDQYHWKSNTLLKETKPLPTSFAAFAHVATSIGANVFITVNYGSGTPEEAAAWVREANVAHDYKMKYWEIGNECYGDWEHDENTPPHDPVTYATRAAEYFKQMKTVDPSIKVGVVVTESYKDRAGVVLQSLKSLKLSDAVAAGTTEWTPTVLSTLKELGVRPDFVDFRLYPQFLPGTEDDARLLQSTNQWSTYAVILRKRLTDCYGDAGDQVELLCSENNSSAQAPGKQTTSLVNGLYLADSWAQIAQTEFNSYLWWDLHNMQNPENNNNPKLYGWRQYGDHGIMSGNDTRYPTFYCFKLLQHFTRPGDKIVHATSDNKLLTAYAALRADDTLTLLFINKNPADTLAAHISIDGYQPADTATINSYGIPQDEAARTGNGSPDLEKSTVTETDKHLLRDIRPYSATVITLSRSG